MSTTAFSDFVWELATVSGPDSNYDRYQISALSRHFNATTAQPFRSVGGSIDIIYRVSRHEQRERSDVLPHLEFTGDSVQLELVLKHLNTSYSNSRFAIELALVSSDKRASQSEPSRMRVYSQTSKDDEFTPGVFKLFNWCTTNKTDENSVDNGGVGIDKSAAWTQGFVQWKPIAYADEDKTTTTSRGVEPSKLQIDPSLVLSPAGPRRQVLTNTALYAFYGESLWSAIMSHSALNLTYGDPKDGYYKSTGYLSWSFSVGVGQVPPSDHLSLLVVGIVLLCVGLPLLLLVTGFLFLFVRRCIRNREPAGYQVIN